MRKLVLVLLIDLFVTGQLNAQSTLWTIQGLVIDSKTKKGISFANISLSGYGIGTASNNAGAFLFKVTGTPRDTIVISCVGYTTAKISLTEAASGETFYLQEAVVKLPELTVQSHTRLEILKQVISKLPENYDTAAVGFTGFYQENIWLGDVELSFVEAAVDIYRPFKATKKPNDQFRILKGRKKQLDYSADPQLYYWLNGTANGVRGSLAEDLIKYHRATFSPFNPRNYRYYNYEHVETIHDGERIFMVLDITPIKPSSKGILRMRLFIDEANLAIAKYTLELTTEGIRRTSRKDKHVGYAIMSKVVHASLEYHKFQYVVSYKQYQGKWYLDRINRHFEIFVDSKRRGWEDQLWRADMNLIMTEINKNAAPIEEGNMGASESRLATMVSNNVNDDFWENYNFIKSDEMPATRKDLVPAKKDSLIKSNHISNRENGFTRRDTLQGKLTRLRSCYDVTFYHLDVAIDVDKHFISGSNAIRFKVTDPFDQFQIDLYSNMAIKKILYKDKELRYTRELDAVYVSFPQTLQTGSEESIMIFYEGTPKEPDFSIPMDGGALWERDSLGNVWAQMVCQGSGASLWWPNKDHLSDEPDSMKIWITIPSEYTEISNGRLTRKVDLPNKQTRYEWEVGYPINNYNVTYNIGKYTHWTKEYINGDTLLLNFYALSFHKSLAKAIYQTVPEMLRVFETNYGKYPFSKDGFTLVESVYPMEHQSGVCIGKLGNPVLEVNHLIWHESAHEWWGNSISCSDMADLWIHEAFATYAEITMIESVYGKEQSLLALVEEQNAVRGAEPVVGVYNVNHIHYDITDMYSKGCLILHTLRSIVSNEEKWKQMLLAVQENFRFKTLTTTDLVKFINNYLQKDYTWFFKQYLYNSTLPTLKLNIQENESSLVVKYKWEADTPGFKMPAKITTKFDHFEWIYPTAQWQTVVLKGMITDDFEVDEDNFLINVDYDLQ